MDMTLTNQEKIIALLDGELPKEEIGTLFLDLHNSETLQDELFQDIQLRNMTLSTVTVPPAVVKEDVLSAVAVSAANAKPIFLEPGFITSVILSLVALLGIYSYTDEIENTSLADIFIPSTVEQNYITSNEGFDYEPMSEVLSVPDPVTVNSYPVSSARFQSISLAEESSTNFSVNNSANSQSYAEASAESQNSSLSHQIRPINTSSVNTNRTPGDITLSSFHPNNYSARLYSADMSNPALNGNGIERMQASFSRNSSLQLDIPMEFTIRGISATSDVNVDLNRVSVPTLNNISLAAHVLMDDNWMLGLEVGQEDYNQVFNGIDKNDRVYYEQVITAFWAGLSLKYQSDPIVGDRLALYSNAFLGGTQVGAIARLGTGISFRLSDNFYLNSGLELNELVYRHQGQIFDTFKYGAVYGISFRP